MAELSGLKRGRARARLVAAATAAALLVTGVAAGSASAADPAPSATAATKAPAASGNTFGTQDAADAPVNALYGVNSSGTLYGYPPNGTGGLDSRIWSGSGWGTTKHMTQADHDADGSADGVWAVEGSGTLYHLFWGEDPVTVGGGWGIYNKVLSTGNLAGAGADDLLARDGSGTLWLYLGYGNGTLTGRSKVGTGWGTYNQITGKGDLTGDGRNDIVARDGGGTLWLYKGTGNRTTPFLARTKVGTGWNIFNNLVSVGDIDLDGITDLLARGTDGTLWRYSGTGNAAAPFKSRVKIGTSGWNGYRLLF
ncbi:FG-GAP repeat domain-containing protein [Streptomyces sp. NPDC018833]|uniref:FG-GAP repeat domain-containing protein n=1 Tax=Streptomyces sp. NPDC018833 TaxID=3365053 RepID=UPI00379F03C1